MTSNQTTNDQNLEETTTLLCRSVAQWFVRKDNKFYDVKKPNVALSRNDVERMILNRVRTHHPEVDFNPDLFKAVFKRAIVAMHGAQDQAIPVWNGNITLHPGQEEALVWDDGAVAINSWSLPEYRTLRANAADYGLLTELLEKLLPREEERETLLNWLAWCLQNEAEKPSWGPLLYSRAKGTGKSTLCQLVAKLFGESNSVTQNNIDLITSRFNMTVLRSKLVISEELQLKPGSKPANMLKSYLTETSTLSEMKGREAERVQQSCCFIFTTNHLPTWIEGDDRRFYVLEIEHDGHAAGANATEFSDFIGRVHAYMRDPQSIAKLYNALMQRELPVDFSAKTLNIATQSTPIMRRLNAASEQTKISMVRDYLEKIGLNAVPESSFATTISQSLRININETRHILSELGWQKFKAKWGGKDYSRAIWLRPEYVLDRGRLVGPDRNAILIDTHLRGSELVKIDGIEVPDEH